MEPCVRYLRSILLVRLGLSLRGERDDHSVADLLGFGTYPIPDQYTSEIPSIAYSVPDLEAYARFELRRVDNDELAACIQATLSNGLTTRQPAVEIATAVFTLVGLLVGLFHAALVNSPSPAQYRWFDILFLYQTVAATGLLHLDYPRVYSAFTQNFHWALGLFYNGNVENSIYEMRARTGGYLSDSMSSGIDYISQEPPSNTANPPVNVNNVTTGFGSFQARDLEKRIFDLTSQASTASIDSNTTMAAEAGLPNYVNTLNIPTANAFDTIFFWFLAFIAITIASHLLFFVMVWAFHKGRNSWAMRLKKTWWSFSEGNAFRLVRPLPRYTNVSLDGSLTSVVPNLVLPSLDLWFLPVQSTR